MAVSPDRSVLTLVQALRGVLAQVADPIHVLRTILAQTVTRTEAERGVFVEVHAGGRLDFRVLHRFDQAALSGEAESFSRTIFAEVLRFSPPAANPSPSGRVAAAPPPRRSGPIS